MLKCIVSFQRTPGKYVSQFRGMVASLHSFTALYKEPPYQTCLNFQTVFVVVFISNLNKVISTEGDLSIVRLEWQTHAQKVMGFNPCRSSGRIFFSRVSFLCSLLFWYSFHPQVTTEACKRSQPFCLKCKWQVTAKHTCILHMWL